MDIILKPRFLMLLGFLLLLSVARSASAQQYLGRPGELAYSSASDARSSSAFDELMRVPPTQSVVLARVIQVDKQPQAVYEHLKQQYPNVDTREWPLKLGGRLQVQERLSGPSTPLQIGVPFSMDNAAKSTVNAYRIPPALRQMRMQQLWILVCDGKTGRISPEDQYKAVLISGPNDRILQVYRVFSAYINRPDREQALQELRAKVLDANQNTFVRLAAYQSLAMMTGKRGEPLTETDPSIAFHSRLVTDLIAQPDLPREIQIRAIATIGIVLKSREIAPLSNEVAQLRYLLTQLEKSRDERIVWLSSEMLAGFLIRAADTSSGTQTVYYYPEIIRALETRQQKDALAFGNSQVNGALSEIEHAHLRKPEDLKGTGSTALILLRELPK
jgi:hypothetical protein